MFTRKDYLDKKCTIREYYSQFVDASVKEAVRSRIGMERLRKSVDEHFNDIPLNAWDYIKTRDISHIDGQPTGDWNTLCSNVCIGKEAARQLLEAERKETLTDVQ